MEYGFDQWQFIVGTYDANAPTFNVRVYVNYGVGGAFDNYTTPIVQGGPIFLGKTSNIDSDGDDEPHFDGNIHEVMIWDATITQDAIEELAGNPPGNISKISPTQNVGGYTFADNLVLHWEFENITEPVVVSSGTPTTASGIFINLDETDIVDEAPTNSNASIECVSSYYEAFSASRMPFPEDYQGSCTIWTVQKFNTNGVTASWGFGNSSNNFDAPFRAGKTSSTNTAYCQINDENLVPYQITGPTLLNILNGVWYSMIVTYDADTRTAQLWVNGIDQGSVTLAADREPTDEFHLLASFFDFGEGQNRHRGSFEVAGFWDRVVTDEERAVLDDLSQEPFLTEHPTLKTNLTAWYRPGEANDRGSNLTDMANKDRNKDLNRRSSAFTLNRQNEYAE
jgi:hypothetical protein